MPDKFEQVNWPMVHDTRHKVSCMFQVQVCKQVMGIDGTSFNQSQYQHDKDPKCPSCEEYVETCSHVLHCNEEGRVSALQQTTALLDEWLVSVWCDMMCEVKGGYYGRNSTRKAS